MQVPKGLHSEEATNHKLRMKKTTKVAPVFQLQGENMKGSQDSLPLSFKKTSKTMKRSLKKEVSPPFQQPERSTSDSLPDRNENRVLRRKYLLLEEESCTLGRELNVLEDEIKILEEEKLALLDELVVLEGLVDPSELHPRPPVL